MTPVRHTPTLIRFSEADVMGTRKQLAGRSVWAPQNEQQADGTKRWISEAAANASG
jgi:hypothetical protein